MANSDLLVAVKALQAELEGQTLAVHQTLQQFMAIVDSKIENLQSQFHRSVSFGNYGKAAAYPTTQYNSAGKTEFSSVLQSVKLGVPKFDGSDPNGWASHIEELFNIHGTPEALPLRIVSFHMEGSASTWYKWMEANNLLTTWPNFLVNLKHRFSAPPHEDYREPLLISYFITGLKPEIPLELLLSRPTTLIETFSLARACEARVGKTKQDSRQLVKCSSKPTPPPQSPLPIQFIPPLLSPPNLPNYCPSQTELQNKSMKRICYYCDQKWTSNHHYNSIYLTLRDIANSDGGMPSEEPKIEDNVDKIVLGNALKLHASTERDNPRTLRLTGEDGYHIFQDQVYPVDLFMLPIDVALSIQWLWTLGRVSHDYGTLSMKFTWELGDLAYKTQLIICYQPHVLLQHDDIHSKYEPCGMPICNIHLFLFQWSNSLPFARHKHIAFTRNTWERCIDMAAYLTFCYAAPPLPKVCPLHWIRPPDVWANLNMNAAGKEPVSKHPLVYVIRLILEM